MMAIHANSCQQERECGNCDSGDRTVVRCDTCGHFLCEFCAAAHQRGRNTKTHALVSLDDVTNAPVAEAGKPTLCKEHAGEVLKYFCETCDKAICRECPIVDHQGHKCVNLKDAFAKAKDDLLKQLDEAKVNEMALSQSVGGITEAIQALETGAENTRTEVRNYFDELVQTVEQRRNELFRKIDELADNNKRGFTVRRDELTATLEIVRSDVELTERALQDGSQVDVLNMKKAMLNRLKNLSSITWRLGSRVDASRVLEFKRDDTIRSMLSGISKLGVIVSKPSGRSGLQIAVTVRMGHGEESVMYNTLRGQLIDFTLITKDLDGRRLANGGAKLRVCIHDVHGKEFTPDVKDCANGWYQFTYTPLEEGPYKLAVVIDGLEVEGSPFGWNCEGWSLTEAVPTENVTFSDQNMTASLEVLREIANENNTIVGTLGFDRGHRLWKCRISFRYTNSFALGVISSRQRPSRNFSCARGRQWTWFPGKKYQPDMYEACDSSLGNVKTNDVFELYLDCNKSKLTILNQRTNQQDTLYGFKDEVFPVFHIWRAGTTIFLVM